MLQGLAHFPLVPVKECYCQGLTESQYTPCKKPHFALFINHHKTTSGDSWDRNDLKLNTLPINLAGHSWWVLSLGVIITKSRSAEYLDKEKLKEKQKLVDKSAPGMNRP